MIELKNIALIFGGKSAEHDISLRSATTIYNNLDKAKYNVFALGITKDGRWFYHTADDFKTIPTAINQKQEVILATLNGKATLFSADFKPISYIDMAFPIVHGPNGEDGSLQGFFATLNLPYAGPNILGSAVSMDKDIAKILLNNKGLKTAKSVTLVNAFPMPTYDDLKKYLSPTMYVKPCNMGSSIGVSKVSNASELKEALTNAFQYDFKVLIEEELKGREIECAVLGNHSTIGKEHHIETSVIGEIIPKTFYSYDEKYVSSTDASLQIPAHIDDATMQKAKEIAKKAYEALQCSVMARVDMFLLENGDIYINEANTLPGFTNISMYPTLWANSGLPINNLLDKIIELSFARFEAESNLKKTF